MRSLLLVVFYISFVTVSFCQEPVKPPKNTAAYYMQKSRTKKATGWVLTGVGIGFLIGAATHDYDQILTDKKPPTAVYITGAVLIATGIAILVSGSRDRKKAETLLVRVYHEPIQGFAFSGKAPGAITALGLRFNLH
ncbi:MAG: hypothetical protein JWQ27_1460 [Ferruginibacter sp.]|nr:hypothetical protein [Ferruginibacter sp.]